MRLNVKAVHIMLTSSLWGTANCQIASQCTYFCLCPTAYDAESTTFQSICITSLSLPVLASFICALIRLLHLLLLLLLPVVSLRCREQNASEMISRKIYCPRYCRLLFSLSHSAVCTTFVCCFNLNVILSLSLPLPHINSLFYFTRRCKGRPECNLECKQMINWEIFLYESNYYYCYLRIFFWAWKWFFELAFAS